jgi:hypothetical protein
LAEPRTFAEDLRAQGFTEDEIRLIMTTNGRQLTVRKP